jgi:hypothetical protein
MLKRYSAKAALEREHERLVGTRGDRMAACYNCAMRTREQLLQLIDKIATENPSVSEDELFSYACQRSREIRG